MTAEAVISSKGFKIDWTRLIALLTGVGLFLVVLVAGLIYEWKMGVLDWGPRPAQERAQMRAARGN